MNLQFDEEVDSKPLGLSQNMKKKPPIGNIWHQVEGRIRTRRGNHQILEILIHVALEEWEQFPEQNVDDSIKTMPARIEAFTKVQGSNIDH